MSVPRYPVSTYRLQFNRDFTFRRAASLTGYFDDLGISDCYASPIFQARAGSRHGYDIIDFSSVNRELGGEAALKSLAQDLRKREMGLLLDIVPNHMCIADPGNRWWNDVLENGPSSYYASFFDIDWNPPAAGLKNKVLLPVLGAPLEEIGHRREFQVAYADGAFQIRYWDARFPLEPKSWVLMLETAVRNMGPDESDTLHSIVSSLCHLPDYAQAGAEQRVVRQREIPAIKKELSRLMQRNRRANEMVGSILDKMNAPGGWNQIRRLLALQPYRLGFWKEAVKRMNYRRFFDINELGGVRVEDPAVFAASHGLIRRVVQNGWVSGLRVDHIDGLWDPEKYLKDLSAMCLEAIGEGGKESDSRFYVVVEKILCGEEKLRKNWRVAGTTGYAFLQNLNGLFVEPSCAEAFRALYARFAGKRGDFPKIVRESKKKILRESLPGEVSGLAALLKRIAWAHSQMREWKISDFTQTLVEIIASFPVYRTYLSGKNPRLSAEDRKYLEVAFRLARAESPQRLQSVIRFIEALFLDAGSLPAAAAVDRRLFLMKFQQLTGPAMAKGYEDTALYRYFPLASLNEVGGEADTFGVSPAEFHRFNRERQKRWPHALSATTTHDTKRSEDVRARLNVLSEIPAEWEKAVRRWRTLNQAHKTRVGRLRAPDANEEYLLYQTLVGAWPATPLKERERTVFVRRIQEYMRKAVREAKVHTSWTRHNERHEEAVKRFIQRILDRRMSGIFLAELESFLPRVIRPGVWNSLSQTLIKIACPGVPDTYQGCETLNFSLVDPDNRRPVPHGSLKRSLAWLRKESRNDLDALLRRLVRKPEDGRSKLFVTAWALAYRRSHPEMFANGAYVPLSARGKKSDHVLAFARVSGRHAAIALAGRFFLGLGAGGRLPLGKAVWGETRLSLKRSIPAGVYRDIFSGEEWNIGARPRRRVLPVSNIFSRFPVALLGRMS